MENARLHLTDDHNHVWKKDLENSRFGFGLRTLGKLEDATNARKLLQLKEEAPQT